MTDNANEPYGPRCQICGGRQGSTHLVREMMFGLRHRFAYFLCDRCDCLQLTQPPADYSDYYPAGQYYAHDEAAPPASPPSMVPRRWLKRRRDAALLFRSGGIFQRVARRFPNPGIADLAAMLAAHPAAGYEMKILDVGCGNGHLLYRLEQLGFESLTGVDPYLPHGRTSASRSSESHSSSAVRLHAQSLESLPAEDPYDLIMMHHAFEHMPEPLEALRHVRQRLTPTGQCYIRIPIVSQGPWQQFGVDWAEIDAPRHFFLHSERSMQTLAAEAGLRVVRIDYESDAFTYAASELYRRDIPLRDADAPGATLQSRFSAEQWAGFERAAQRDRRPGWAGRAAFTLALGSSAAPAADQQVADQQVADQQVAGQQAAGQQSSDVAGHR
ncbi:class I SAM-dependent methyltransferase [Roseimaritima sediminicola]|uniref:class I SAM-dependent methyltransferase n=1 Tax=Roseimaritima sediminicola TaxID=2662066 RepID=UPI0012984EC1|nr:class I SAM-dependent methyltransferase [Roseimaritima sediminicola]